MESKPNIFELLKQNASAEYTEEDVTNAFEKVWNNCKPLNDYIRKKYPELSFIDLPNVRIMSNGVLLHQPYAKTYYAYSLRPDVEMVNKNIAPYFRINAKAKDKDYLQKNSPFAQTLKKAFVQQYSIDLLNLLDERWHQEIKIEDFNFSTTIANKKMRESNISRLQYLKTMGNDYLAYNQDNYLILVYQLLQHLEKDVSTYKASIQIYSILNENAPILNEKNINGHALSILEYIFQPLNNHVQELDASDLHSGL